MIVIGEGERDEAPMLYIGEKVGRGGGPRIDIALDPAGRHHPDRQGHGQRPGGDGLGARRHHAATRPTPIWTRSPAGRAIPTGVIDLDAAPAENAQALAEAKGVDVAEITVCVLDRPRHAEIIASLREVGARVHLITDGDVAGVINTADPDTGVDIYVGQGGAPEGVLACAALKCVGGQFQGRLVFRNADERARAKGHGITDLDKKYDLHEMVRADAIFAATGVTNGALLDGVQDRGGFVHTHTLVMNSATGTVREVRMKRRL